MVIMLIILVITGLCRCVIDGIKERCGDCLMRREDVGVDWSGKECKQMMQNDWMGMRIGGGVGKLLGKCMICAQYEMLNWGGVVSWGIGVRMSQIGR